MARRSRGRRPEPSGFKGARKSTPFAAGRAAEKAAAEARKSGMMEIEVKVKGPRRWVASRRSCNSRTPA